MKDNVETTADIKVANKDFVIDMNKNTLHMKHYFSMSNGSNIEFNNSGEINFSDSVATENSLTFLSGTNTKLTFNNVKVKAENYTSNYGIFYQAASSTIEVNNCVFDIANDASTSGGVFKSDERTTKVFINNSNLNFDNVLRGFTYNTVEIKNSTVNITSSGPSPYMTETGFSHADVTIDNSDITISDLVKRGIRLSGADVEIKNNSKITINNSKDGIVFLDDTSKVIIDKTSYLKSDKVNFYKVSSQIFDNNGNYITINPDKSINIDGVVAKIENTEYLTLDIALKNARSGDTITLLKNAVTNESLTLDFGNLTFDLAKNTWKLNVPLNKINTNSKVIIKNGNLEFHTLSDLENNFLEIASSESNDDISELNLKEVTMTSTAIDKVMFLGNNSKLIVDNSKINISSGEYGILINENANVEIKNKSKVVIRDMSSGEIIFNGTGTAKVILDNCEASYAPALTAENIKDNTGNNLTLKEITNLFSLPKCYEITSGDESEDMLKFKLTHPVDHNNITKPSNNGTHSNPTYRVIINETSGGSVSVKPKFPKRGVTVTVTIVSDEGKELDELIIKNKNGELIEFKETEDNTYTYIQPKGNTTIEARFKCDGISEYCDSTKYLDLNTSDWYHEATDYAIKNKLMNGYGDNYFRPNDNITRAMLVQILYNLENRPEISLENIEYKFNDVEKDSWYAKAIYWAQANKIILGYDNGNFGANDVITREQLAVILWRYNGGILSNNDTLEFKDTNKISDFAIDALLWATENKIINGKGNEIIDPKGKATRAEVSQIFYNIYNNN